MDDGGKADEKIIAIPVGDPTYNTYRDITELPSHIFDEMAHFFTVYKALEAGANPDIQTVKDVNEARLVITDCMERYLNDFCR